MSSISANQTHRIWPAWAVWLGAALVLYAATASRGTQWQDSGYFILRILRGELMNPLGLALTHPLHFWMGRFAIRLPGLEPAYAITLISSLGGALAVANLFGCVMALTGCRLAAGLAAASLMMANTFWQLSTVVETYSLAAAFLTAQCWCVTLLTRCDCQPQSNAIGSKTTASARWAFLAACALNGLSFSNHNLALLTAPMVGAAALVGLRQRRISIALLPLGVVVWALAASPHLVLIVRDALNTGNIPGTIRSTLFGTAFEDRVLSTAVSWRLLLISSGFVLLNFPNLLLPAALVGVWRGLRWSASNAVYWVLFLGFFLHTLFAFRYPVPDQHYFFLSTYVFLCMFGGVGFAHWAGALQSTGIVRTRLLAATAALIVATPILYAFVPTLCRKVDALGYVERNKPYRDDYVYLFTPWSVVERSAERLSKEAADLAGESGVIIVEDGMAEFAVRYELDRRGRDGVEVFMPEMEPKGMVAAMESERSIVLVPRDADHPTALPLRGTWRRHGDLYELVPDPSE